MASVTKNKGNKKNKLMVTDEELNTIHIALAILDYEAFGDEIEEKGFTREDLADPYNVFLDLDKATKLYPTPQIIGDIIEAKED